LEKDETKKEELSKEFNGTTLPARLEQFNALLKGPFFLGDKVRYKIPCRSPLVK